MIFKDLGVMPYRQAWQLQHELMNDVQNGAEDIVLMVEHKPIFTLGFHGNISNMLVNDAFLKSKGIELIRIERGGDITYHGPGQLVAYPILDLRRNGIGVRQYVNILEECVIQLLRLYDIDSERDDNAPGVWLEVGSEKQRKICALGVKVSHAVTMHGLALNVNTDLTPFSYINPCGFANKGVTSMAIEKNQTFDTQKIKCDFSDIFKKLLRR